MSKWQVNGHPDTRNFYVGGDQRFTTTNRGPHWLAKLWVDHRTAVLHVTVSAYDRCLPITDGRGGEHRDGLCHQAVAELAAYVEQRGQILDETASYWIADYGRNGDSGNGITGLTKPVCMNGFFDEHGLTNYHL
jgi:hypothetical protein